MQVTCLVSQRENGQLTIKNCLPLFGQYGISDIILLRILFCIITYHKPLLGLRKLTIEGDRTGRRGRWALELDTYDFIIKHRPGKIHTNADALSRRPGETEQFPEDTNWETNISNPASFPTIANCHHITTSVSVQTEECTNEMHLPRGTTLSEERKDLQTTKKSNEHGDEQSIPTLAVDIEDIRQKQRSDPIVNEVIWWKSQGHRPKRSHLRQSGR